MDNTTPLPGHGSDPSATSLGAMVARAPEDLVAFAPIAVGFTPRHSVVMLTFGGPRPFHARVDLPEDPADVDELAATLLRPALKHGVHAVVFVLYDDDTCVADEAAWTLSESFDLGGIDVVEVLRVHDDHWYAMLPGHPAEAYRGVRFDCSAHPFTIQAIVDGRVTRASREELGATLAPDRDAVARVQTCLREAVPLGPGELRSLVAARMRSRSRFSDLELASVALAITHEDGREAIWSGLDRAGARVSVELWSDAVRRLPDSHAGSAAAVLGLAAWVAGEGALAWCAVDRCRAVHPEHALAALVAELLETATPPDEWDALRAAAGLEDPAA